MKPALPSLVILAAGASVRLGACKALVDLGGISAIERLLAAAACLDGIRPLVVTGADHLAIAAALAGRPVEIAHNAAWPAGRTGSVRVARERRTGWDLVLAPVDVPLVPRQVFEGLSSTWLSAGSPPRGWLAPRRATAARQSAALHGHPVVVGRELLAELDLLAPGAPLRLLRERAQPLWSLEVDAVEVLDDLDTPADLDRIRRRLQGLPPG